MDLSLQEIAEPLFDLKLGMEQLSSNQTFRRILATLLAIGNFLNSSNVRMDTLLHIRTFINKWTKTLVPFSLKKEATEITDRSATESKCFKNSDKLVTD